MNLNSSLKKIICFLLAVLMLLGTVACKDTGKKKKVIKKVKKKVIVVQEDDTNDNNSSIIEDEEEEEEEEEVKVRPTRKLPEVAEVKEEYVEPIIPEFEYEYKALNLSNDYVIVYSYEQWKDRYESLNEDKSKRQIKETAFNKITAEDLKVYFNEKYGLDIKVVRDIDPEAASAAKKILVGDTIFYKSSLADNEFAVKIMGENLVFEGGHFAMVEKAVDWYQTVEIKSGHVATLTGKQDNFSSSKMVNVTQKDGTKKLVEYKYVWGDEFDGKEFIDEDKWAQGTFGLERQDDMLNIFNDPQFQYVENGKLRLTGDRYFDEGNAAIGYATSGQIDTDGKMLFRNGYYEFYARLPYTRGGFPAIWTMTADAVGVENVPNYYYDDGYGIYSQRVWDLEFDLFESFADTDHMTTTIHKWYTPRNNTSFSSYGIDLTIDEEIMVAADRAEVKSKADGKTQWVYDSPLVKTDNADNDPTKGNPMYYYLYYLDGGKTVYVTAADIAEQNNQIADGDLVLSKEQTLQYKVDNGLMFREYVSSADVTKQNDEISKKQNENAEYKVATKQVLWHTYDIETQQYKPVTKELDDTWQALIDAGILVEAHVRYKIEMNVKQKDGSYSLVDMFKYRLSPFTNMSKSMNTYAYQFTYYGEKGSGTSVRRQDEDGIYADWRWYFNEETINNEYHLYALHVTTDHCTVYMDDQPFLDFDWDPGYDYKDLDGDGKGDDVSNNNNGVGFNFWQYFLIDMMIYTPGNFKIDDVRKLQAGDVPLHLYIDYVRAYQDLSDNSQAIYFPNGEAK